MTDMLVKLYALPPLESGLMMQEVNGVSIRRALAAEKHFVAEWVGHEFSMYWRSECEIVFSNKPVSCFVAVKDGVLVGFACYETTRKGVFGPTGVQETVRGRGIGKALLLACLHSMWMEGYAYAIIGGVGPVDYYRKTVGAVEIEDSTPGMYRGLLRTPSSNK